MIRKAYKVTGRGGAPCHGGDGAPWIAGEWREERGRKACDAGMLHLCRDERDLLTWLGPEIWEAEYDDERLVIEENDKVAVQRARVTRRLDTWNERTARLFACDCAEAVLRIYESQYPGDSRPRAAVEISRRYAYGQATDSELATAGAAAWDAAWAAARATARDAARAAASAAAWAAAWAAASDAASAAASAAARDAQAQRLRWYLDGCPEEAK